MITFIAEEKDRGRTVQEFFAEQALDFTPIAYSINKEMVPHFQEIQPGDFLESYSATHKYGYAVYQRSLIVLLDRVVSEVVPEGAFEISHSISKAIYGCFTNGLHFTQEQVRVIREKMMEMVQANLPFEGRMMPRTEALELMQRENRRNEKWMYGTFFPPEFPVYSLDGGQPDYSYGPLVPSTGLLGRFDLRYYMPGLLLILAKRNNPGKLFEFHELPKIFDIIDDNNRITDILDISYATGINKQIIEGRGKELILIGEALQEGKIAAIAKHINDHRDKYQLVMISGPSSSGKTTFSRKLEIALKAFGENPISLSLDDFYLNREDTPLDHEGKPDFESLAAIDKDLFQKVLEDLINGEEVEIPSFNFHTGKREYRGRRLRKAPDSPLIIEGIHGLNPNLTNAVPRHLKYIIYVTALTQVNLDPLTYLKTTDARLLRRIIRDHRFRSFDAERTLSLWPSVRRGEERNIFVYQELADVHFNSNLPYELNVLKYYAEPYLKAVPYDSPHYMDARHLLNILRYVEPLDDEWVPSFSVLREFIGRQR